MQPWRVAEFLQAAIKGMNMNRQGQSCSSTSRVFVHASLHQAVAEEIVRLAEALPVGFPWIAKNELGPVVSAAQHARIMDFIESGKKQGAKLLTGGGKGTDWQAASNKTGRASRIRRMMDYSR